ncbi:hypothetical protein H8356DRAFT_1352449 [Neocallimastix lanati (nom. inval.)]|nr:hypothetical protein H8356DRAFT_1352449 [Neocallimastix sp. JGI-2020a]
MDLNKNHNKINENNMANKNNNTNRLKYNKIIIDYNSIKDNEIIKINSKNNFENNNNKKQKLKKNKIYNNISDIKNLNNKLKIFWVLKNYKYRRKILLINYHNPS